MTLWEVYKELELLAAVHGWDTPLIQGGVEGGDPIDDVWYDDQVQHIYIN